MNANTIKHYIAQEKLHQCLLSVLTFLCLILTLVGINFNLDFAFTAFSANRLATTSQQPLQPEQVKQSDNLTLLNNIPHINHVQQLSLTNYREDAALREAILAKPEQWKHDPTTAQIFYQASNHLTIYLHSLEKSPLSTTQLSTQQDTVLLTARILMGLWVSRHTDQSVSTVGKVAVRTDEILAWRGVQKHQRQAYAGTLQRFTDGYQWKHKQQVAQDIAVLAQFHVQGEQYLVQQGKVLHTPVQSPYMSITPIENDRNKTMGYLVAPGPWLAQYLAHHNVFLTGVDRRLFSLNPRNDYLALRMGFYLIEHWRREIHKGDYQAPITMIQLLTNSMITVDKANLTSRFAPRVEAALQKLFTHNILGENQ